LERKPTCEGFVYDHSKCHIQFGGIALFSASCSFNNRIADSESFSLLFNQITAGVTAVQEPAGQRLTERLIHQESGSFYGFLMVGVSGGGNVSLTGEA